MKHFTRLLFVLVFFSGTHVLAQEVYTISGVVINESQEPIKGATIFISGSKKITATDAAGRFTFGGITAGNYLISTKMLGYNTPSKAIIVQDKSVSISIALKVSAIVLNEVTIGTDKNREKNYETFKNQFLGTSASAKKCSIINPEIIYFSRKNILPDYISLKAEANDLLIIENQQLGYRIKYLLRTFEYNSKTLVTYYDGDSNFEELNGTVDQKKIWAKNRLDAYNGSLMHFLRSVYANQSLNEGFITNQMVKSRNSFDRRTYMNPYPVSFDTLVTTLDSSFISFKFTALNVTYNPKKIARLQKKEFKRQEKTTNKPLEKTSQDDLLTVDPTGESSQLLLHLKEAIIDARGSAFSGSQTFLIRGSWANKRIGDQLPFEYLPPKTDN